MIEYKGYYANPTYDEEANVFHGEVLGLRDVVTFEADCTADLIKAFHDSVDDYLAFCRERGEEPEKAFSGKFQLRLEKDLHKKLSILAARENKSLNTLVVEYLGRAVSETARGATDSHWFATVKERSRKSKAKTEAYKK